MSDEQEYLKIEVEEEPTVYRPDPTQPPVGERLSEAGQRAAAAAQSAWQSEARRQATTAVRQGAAAAAERGRAAVGKAVSTQTRRKVRHGLAGGVQWLSERLARIADRLTPPPK